MHCTRGQLRVWRHSAKIPVKQNGHISQKCLGKMRPVCRINDGASKARGIPPSTRPEIPETPPTEELPPPLLCCLEHTPLKKIHRRRYTQYNRSTFFFFSRHSFFLLMPWTREPPGSAEITKIDGKMERKTRDMPFKRKIFKFFKF